MPSRSTHGTFEKGNIPWNKGKKGVQPCSEESKKKRSEALKRAYKIKNWNLGRKHTEEWRKHNSEASIKCGKGKWMLGRKISPEIIAKTVAKNRGKKRTPEQKERMRKSSPRGCEHPNWKGGVTPIYKVIRESLEYKLWRTAVFERDNYTCVWCGQKGGVLNADHIKRFADYPELRFAIDNGRTLCVPCHKTTDTYGGRRNSNATDN